MKNIKQVKTVIISIIMVIIAYGIMQYMGITCPIKYITGISCAGCGMTRAWIALLHFDINTAFMYHPLLRKLVMLCGLQSIELRQED